MIPSRRRTWKPVRTYLPPDLVLDFARACAIDRREVPEILRGLIVEFIEKKLGSSRALQRPQGAAAPPPVNY